MQEDNLGDVCAEYLSAYVFALYDDIRAYLFFALYVIYKKNYSFSRVVFLFLYKTKIGDSSFSKINDSGRLRTTRFSRNTFGVRVTALPNFFYDLSLTFLDTRN